MLQKQIKRRIIKKDSIPNRQPTPSSVNNSRGFSCRKPTDSQTRVNRALNWCVTTRAGILTIDFEAQGLAVRDGKRNAI